MSDMYSRLVASISDSINVKQLIFKDELIIETIMCVTDEILAAMRRGNRVYFGGNGGSAADAQHLAAEFVSKFEFDRPGLPAISLSTDTSMITAISNDYGYERLFVRQLEAQARPQDIFIGITTSGKSPNILKAFEACSRLNLVSIAMCGLGGDIDGKVDHAIRVPSYSTPRIQECHILIGHIICAEVEFQIFKSKRLN